jgi:large subunit ribosomal protein L19
MGYNFSMAKRTKYQDKTISVGDFVRLHLKLIEGGKERTQPFDGIILSIKGSGDQRMITVRKIATGGVGVERIIPLSSPWLAKIDVRHSTGRIHRAKLYNLRRNSGV